MNRNKIKDFIKKNKIAVGVTGTILAVGLLFGVGYGVHSLNKSDGSETKDMVVEANKDSEFSNDEVSTTDIKSEDNKNEQEDTKEVAVNNTDKSNEVNKKEQEDKATSESNKTDDGNKNNGTSTDNQENTSTTSKGEGSKGTSNVSTTTSNNSTGNTSSTHSHSWTPVKKTINHKEQGHYENVLVKPAWTEKVPVYEERERSICNGCGADITSDPYTHNENHMLNGEKGGWHSEWKKVQVGTKTIKHDAVYKKKWVVDKKAYTETKITGYKCSCGATK